MLIACPPHHIGFVFVSHPLCFLLPRLVSALVALSLCLGPLFLHVLLVCNLCTLHPCVLQYPAGSKMRSASDSRYIWCCSRGQWCFYGGFAVGSCCILSKRVFIAASCATKLSMSVLSLVAALAMLLSANAMAVLSTCASVTLLAVPKEFELARCKRRRLMLASRYYHIDFNSIAPFYQILRFFTSPL